MEYYLLIILFFIFVLYDFSSNKSTEKLENISVDNAYSNTKCIDDSLPLIKYHPLNNPNTFRCLSVDGTNCIDRQTLSIPTDYTCSDAKKNVNFYLSVDGIRNVRVNPNLPISKVYNDFENLRLLPDSDPKLNKNVKYLTCTSEGLVDPQHWCGQLWNKVKSQCNEPKGKFGEFSELCKNVPGFIESDPKTGNKIIETNYTDISNSQKQAMIAQQAIRSVGARRKK